MLRPLTYLFLAVMIGMVAYESLKTLAFPHITMWQSHLVTIVVSGIAAAVAGYFLMKQQSRALDRAIAEILRRKNAEKALIESEERYRVLFEGNLAGVFTSTTSGYVLECNQAMAHILGFDSPKELRDRQMLDFYYSEVDRVNFHERVLSAGRLTNFEIRLRRKDGTPVWLIANLNLVTEAAGGQEFVEGTMVDITERKLAEFENTRLAGIVNSSDDAIFSISREGLITTWNAGAERMYGYAAEEIKGEALSVLIPEEHRDVLAADKEGVFRGEALFHYENENQRKDGSRVEVSLILSPLKDATGAVIGASAIARDVSASKRAAQMLLDYERVVEGLDDLIGVVDRQYRYLLVNQALLDRRGLKREEVYGRRVEEVVGKEYFETVVKNKLDECFQGRVIHYEGRRQYPDLGERDMLISYFPIAGPRGIDRAACVVRDLTERKRAEAENARLRMAIEQSVEGVVITNATGDIEYVNPAFTQITGYDRDEALGRNTRMLRSGQHEAAFYEQLWATILKGKIWHGELVNRRKDGKLYTEEMNISPVRDEGGEITHFIATNRDVTDRRNLEGQFRQAQKMEAVGRLAGGVAHDFNNLLTVIEGYSQMVLDGLQPDDATRGPIEEIQKAGHRAASLTRQLLAFSRQQVLNVQVLDLNVLVADVKKMLGRLIGEDIDFAIIQALRLGRVKADPAQIDQILMNLAVNSRDAMPEGGKLTIETSNVEFDEAFARSHPAVAPGRYVMFAVTDTGSGMDADTRAHIFEPFFTTKEAGKGTGLGLAMVYGTVKQSGGHIWVCSEPGQGTTFKVCLPRVEEAEEAAQASPARGLSAAGSETVLLVEDQEAVRALAATVLSELGYKVLESTSADDALRIGERHKDTIHVLLTDVVLPKMSGRKVAEQLARGRPGLKVLYMSGYTDDAVGRHGVLGADTAFLQKPFSPSALARKMREVLDAGRTTA